MIIKKKLISLILIIIVTAFIAFLIKPYVFYHLIYKVFPASKHSPDTLSMYWTNNSNIELDSIKQSYRGKRYLFPKPPYIKAQINRKLNCKFRLKGDYIRHILRDEWSFKLKINDHNSWLKNQKINFHHPAERLDINEFVFLNFMKEKGLLSIDYDFVLVNKNDTIKQLYAYEEAIGNYFLKKRNLNGVILRFDEKPFFKWMMYHNPESFPDELMNRFFLNSKIYNKNKISLDKIKLYNEAVLKLNLWRKEELKTSDIFDLNKTALFFALTEIWGAKHGIDFNNIRLYYDNLTRKFEFIANDGESMLNNNLLCCSKKLVTSLFFKDDVFKKKYFQYLKTYSSGYNLSYFLLKNLYKIKSRSKLIESHYKESDNNLAYLNYNLQLIQNFIKKEGNCNY